MELNTEYILFHYRYGHSLLHRMPAWIKIITILTAGCIVFAFPVPLCIVFILSTLAAAVFCGFSCAELLQTARPAVWYACFLYSVTVLSRFASELPGIQFTQSLFMPAAGDILLSLRFTLSLLITSLLFRTTTPLALRQGLGQIETRIRKLLRMKDADTASAVFALVLLFIPLVTESWHKLDYAWKARGGRNTVKKYAVLFPVLFSVCMHSAWETSLAIKNRCRQE